MRKYLATLHKRPAHHKKRFALAVSSTVTLLIFALWVLVTFGTGGTQALSDSPTTSRAHPEVGPIASLRSGAASSIEALRGSINELRSGVFNTYGQ